MSPANQANRTKIRKEVMTKTEIEFIINELKGVCTIKKQVSSKITTT